MPIPTDYRDIVTLLAAKTREGNVHWRRDRTNITLVVDQTKFALWIGTDEQSGKRFIALGLYDARGNVIDVWIVDQSDSDYIEMHDFYQAAKRHALGLPDRLRKLTDRISSMSVIGTPEEI